MRWLLHFASAIAQIDSCQSASHMQQSLKAYVSTSSSAHNHTFTSAINRMITSEGSSRTSTTVHMDPWGKASSLQYAMQVPVDDA
jgi:hypothetical protein